MSFGGSAQAMITTLKNNEKMRSKREKFKRTFRKHTGVKPEYDFPKATPEQLAEIRQRLKKENKILWIKVTALSTIIIMALVWMLFAS